MSQADKKINHIVIQKRSIRIARHNADSLKAEDFDRLIKPEEMTRPGN